jgi:DNA-binding NtrC family response regulator
MSLPHTPSTANLGSTPPEPWLAADEHGPLVGGTLFGSIRRLISLAGPTEVPVLVTGESGTGKEVVARMLHHARARSGPFVLVHCTAIPEAVVEAELFGDAPGVNGDPVARRGLFASAAGGTVFLDEVGDLPRATQARLRRAIEEGVVRPLGGGSYPLNVRIVSATSRDPHPTRGLDAELATQLARVEIALPPLRDRPEDLPALAAFLLRRAQLAPRTITGDALEALARYDWPHNVRELDGVLRQIAAADRAELTLDQLPERIRRTVTRPASEPPSDTLRTRLTDAIRRNAGNVRRASQELGIARGHVYRLIHRWSIPVSEFRRPRSS